MSWPQPDGNAVGLAHPYYAWTPDSRGWVAVVRRGKRLVAATGSLDQPEVVRTIGQVHAIKPDAFLPGHSVLGVTPARHAVVAIWDREQDGSVLVLDFPIDRPNPATHAIRVALLRGRLLKDLALSPAGTQLGWVLSSLDGRSRDELWVSGADGTHFRKLAEVSYAPLFPMEDEHHPEFLAWTPDGKHLSFVYKDVVWTVVAE